MISLLLACAALMPLLVPDDDPGRPPARRVSPALLPATAVSYAPALEPPPPPSLAAVPVAMRAHAPDVRPTGVVGRVVDGAGVPVASAEVELAASDGGDPAERRAVARVVAGPGGEFRFAPADVAAGARGAFLTAFDPARGLAGGRVPVEGDRDVGDLIVAARVGDVVVDAPLPRRRRR